MSINLLPWREWERKRLSRAFLVQLAAVAVAAIATVLVSGSQVNAATQRQLARNAVIAEALTTLEGEVARVAALFAERDVLLAEGDAIERMHGSRFLAAYTFSELAATMPARVRYTSVTLADGLFEATGAAESNKGVSALMRNLDRSAWFERLTLKGIEEDGGDGAVTFSLGFSHAPEGTPPSPRARGGNSEAAG
ncbi:MAG: PilN domain-containing protein [Gammaproteobacteria bacterium]|nr:PilN domain-containing protein [Gammaproteobacteria bacterium]